MTMQLVSSTYTLPRMAELGGIGARIRERREQLGMTQTQLGASEGLKVSRAAVAQWEGGGAPTADKIEWLAKALKCSAEWLLSGEGSPTAPREVVPAEEAPDLRAEAPKWPATVPVLGTAIGGAEGDFTLNLRGRPIDYKTRPPAISAASKVFALYVQGDSMARWRNQGEFVYVDSSRPARPGDHVVVELHPLEEDEPHPAYLKELIGPAGNKLRLKQYNPEKIIEIPMKRVLQIHRVLEWWEVLGL